MESHPPAVYREHIEPHWIDGNTHFWYRNDGPDGRREFLLVDAERGTRSPAFDHAAVARQIGEDVAPDRLPIEELAFSEDGATITLLGADRAWSLDRVTGNLTELPADAIPAIGLEPQERIQASKGGDRETAILFENRRDREVALFWVDHERQRRPYGTIPPGERRRQHTFAGHAWLVTDAEGKPLAAFVATARVALAVIDEHTPKPRPPADEEPPPTCVPSPDGRWEAFARDHKLYVRRVEDGSELQLSEHGDANCTFRRDAIRARAMQLRYDQPDYPESLPEVLWSPDSIKLLAIKTTVVPEPRVYLIESSPSDQLQPKLHSYPYLKPGDPIPQQHLHLFDVEWGGEIPLDESLIPNPWSLGRFEWREDATGFYFLYNQRGHQVLRVIVGELEAPPNGSAPRCTLRTIVEETSDTFVNYSNKTYLHRIQQTDELIWMSERSGWNHLYLYDACTGEVKCPITQGEWVVRGVDHVDEEKRQIWFRACGVRGDQDPYHIHHCRVNFDGADLTILTEGDGTHEIQWSPDRRWFIDTWSRVDRPPVHALRRAEDGSLVCWLEEADASELLEAGYQFPERFVAKGRDGQTDIYGIIHRPRGFDPDRSYPVIECIYAGPHGQHVPKAFRGRYRHQQEIADRGCIVVQIDGMGTNWRSKRFLDVAWKNLRDAGFPDRIAWMQEAAKTRPWMDLSRVGIYGGSAGGQNAMRALLDHPEFYKAAAADCGCHDNRMDKIWWNEAWMGWPVDESYERSSNVVDAPKLQGALLLTVGELDRNVDPSSTYQVVHALKEAGKRFEFMLLTGQGHGACESDYGRALRADFFVRHLKHVSCDEC